MKVWLIQGYNLLDENFWCHGVYSSLPQAQAELAKLAVPGRLDHYFLEQEDLLSQYGNDYVEDALYV